MNLQQLRYVVATAELGTMTRAASACHVGQPALTRAVRALERELATTVFVRHGRSVVVTPEGQEVVARARRVLVEVARLEALAKGAGPGSVLTLAATPTLQSDLGAGLIEEYWEAHPTFTVQFLSCESPQAVAEAVGDGRADAGVADLPVPDGLVVVPYERQEVVVLGPPGTVLPDPFPVTSLVGLRLIAPRRGSERRAELDAMFAGLGVRPTVAFESDERGSWIPAVLAGIGCCLWYRSRGEVAAAQGAEVVALDPPMARSIAVVHRPDRLSPPVEALVAVARARAEPVPATARQR